jgi:O-antigen/teichoic acid export membrane protein
MGAVGVVVVLRRPVRTFGRIGEAFALLGPIARFGRYILAGAVVYQVNWSVDRIIVAHFHGAAEVGVLTVALQITTMFMLFGIMLSNVFTPLVNEYASDPRQAEKIHVLFLRIGRYEATVLGLFLAVFLVVGKDFIHFWLGPGYQGAFYATAIFMIGGIWAFVQSLGPEIQKAKNLHRFRTVVLLLSSAFKILLSFLLVGRWGVVGAAVSTAVTLVLFDGAAMNWYYSRRLGLPVGRFWRQLLPVTGVVVGSIVVGGLPGLAFGPEPSLLGIGAQALVAGLAFGVGCWFVVLTSEEKARISGMLRR